MTHQQNALVESVAKAIYNSLRGLEPWELLERIERQLYREKAQAAIDVCVDACAKVAFDLAETAAAKRMDCTHKGDRWMLRQRSDAYARAAQEIRNLKALDEQR